MTELNPIDIMVNDAVNAYRQGDTDRAQSLFLNVLNADNSNPDALYYMCMIDHTAGRYEVAEYRAEELLKQKPLDSAALNLMGTVLMSQRKADEAITWFDKGIKNHPDDPVLKVNAAICNIGLVKPSKSIELCKDAININKDYINAWNILGNAYMADNDMQEATSAFEKALELQPDFHDARFNLGVSLFELKRYQLAEDEFDKILATIPEHTYALVRKADVLMVRNRIHEAAVLYQKATEIRSDFVPALIGRGRVFMQLKKSDEALSNFRRALELNPNNIDALMNTGITFSNMDQKDAAAAAFNDVLSIDPDNAQAKFLLASVSDDDVPARPEGDYIKNLFDELAETYDDQLSTVGYDLPEQLYSIVKQHTDSSSLEVVDLGCGTGLSGQAFKPLSANLMGVDLSPLMLKSASKRGIYNELIEDDILGALVRHQNKFDLVISVDTFPYIGDLESAFVSITSALKPGGIVAFTTERHDGDLDVVLSASARYRHSEDYIRSIAERRDLEILHCEQAMSEKTPSVDAPNMIIALRKQA